MVEGQEGEGAAQRGGLLEGAVFGEGEIDGHVVVEGRSKGGRAFDLPGRGYRAPGMRIYLTSTSTARTMRRKRYLPVREL
jgi:hypothetical protein